MWWGVALQCWLLKPPLTVLLQPPYSLKQTEMKFLEPKWSLYGMSLTVPCWNHPDSVVGYRLPVIILKSPAVMMLLFWRQKVLALPLLFWAFAFSKQVWRSRSLGNCKCEWKLYWLDKQAQIQFSLRYPWVLWKLGAASILCHRDTERETGESF